MFVLRYPDEDVGSCVYRERDVCLIGLLASMAYPINLVLSFPEGAVLWEAVFQVATNRTGLNGQSDCFSHFLGRVSITALEIHRHRESTASVIRRRLSIAKVSGVRSPSE